MHCAAFWIFLLQFFICPFLKRSQVVEYGHVFTDLMLLKPCTFVSCSVLTSPLAFSYFHFSSMRLLTSKVPRDLHDSVFPSDLMIFSGNNVNALEFKFLVFFKINTAPH